MISFDEYMRQWESTASEDDKERLEAFRTFYKNYQSKSTYQADPKPIKKPKKKGK